MPPTLTVNGTFIREFISADAPCFALGLVEAGKRRCGFLALRPGEAIPREGSELRFRFSHSLFGNANFEVVHFAFEFYGFETYNGLVKPNTPLARAVVEAMVESGDYFFFALDSNKRLTAFRSKINEDNLMMLKIAEKGFRPWPCSPTGSPTGCRPGGAKALRCAVSRG